MNDDFLVGVEQYVQHVAGCEKLKPAPHIEPVMRDGLLVGIRALSFVERAEIERNRECSCGCDDFKASLLAERVG